VLTRADGDHVRIVVLAGQLRGREVPDERRTYALDLVRGDLLAVSGAAEDDAERLDARTLIGDDGLRRADAERRVVVDRVVLDGAVIDDLVPGGAQMVLQLRGEVEARVVGGDMDAHVSHPRSARRSPRGHGATPAAARLKPARMFSQQPGRHTSNPPGREVT